MYFKFAEWLSSLCNGTFAHSICGTKLEKILGVVYDVSHYNALLQESTFRMNHAFSPTEFLTKWKKLIFSPIE
uniref:Uncharacterized protein n=1 Tax=Sphaerodactylus townsendi TaxID=933632 RepID=A0ACB8G9R7_9SAUR